MSLVSSNSIGNPIPIKNAAPRGGGRGKEASAALAGKPQLRRANSGIT